MLASLFIGDELDIVKRLLEIIYHLPLNMYIKNIIIIIIIPFEIKGKYNSIISILSKKRTNRNCNFTNKMKNDIKTRLMFRL